LSHPIPVERIGALGKQVDQLVVVEEIEPLIETELKAAGLTVTGKEVLPRTGEMTANVLRSALEPQPETASKSADLSAPVFPRPPTMCVACPHLGVYFCLSRLRNLIISGDIGCYTLGAGHPWNALDATISMGASMGMALGLDKGRGESDQNKSIVAVIGDSTFLHMGMQGLLDITYNQGNVTILLLDNRTTGMTGGQENPGSGRDLYGNPAPAVDFVKLVEALGVKPERVKVVNPYELPTLFKALREETKINEPSVIITDQPCVLTDRFDKHKPLAVDEQKCTGCGTCLDVGCPAILVTRRDKEVKPSGKEVDLAFVKIETAACTGCNLCTETCGPDAIEPA